MNPIAVMPLHDPEANVLPNLMAAGTDLASLFSTVLLGLTARTSISQPEYVERLREAPVFQVQVHGQSMPVGAELRALFTLAAASFAPEQPLHLCFPDRVVFALNSDYRATFLADMSATRELATPLLFQRSESAWQSHPANYRRLEGMITEVGQLMFSRSLDFAWCHLVVTAGRLAAVLPRTTRRDFGFLAEVMVLLRAEVATRDVDWLAWEDPFIYGRDPNEMKAEREADPAEVHKRLSYVLPMIEVLSQAE
jgi:hypothetical protein